MRPTRSGLVAGLAGLCLAVLPAGRPALAQLADLGGGLFGGQPYGGALPNLGGDVRIGELRPQLERYFRTSTLPPNAPAWVFSGGMGVDVGATDNAQHAASPRRADVYTILTPYLGVASDTTRIKTNLGYAPQIQVYANNGSQNQISQYFNGQSLITFVPDALFLDLRGSITQSSLTGTGTNGFNTQTGSTYNRQNEVETISFSITPYAEHRFGGWGTGRVGYSFARTLQETSSNQAQTVNSLSTLGTPGYGAIGNLTTQRERASFASGENFGRFNELITVEAVQYNGGGSYRGAHRNQLQNQLGFALTRKVTLIGGVGYQDIVYGGVPVVRINEPTWNTGVRYTPNADTMVTVLYGRRDGSASASLDAQFAPTARTRVFARYSTGITSDVEEAQNLLNTTSAGPGGLLVDNTTGAPVSSGGSFGTQNGIYRVKRFSVSGLLLGARDSYSLTISSEDRQTLTNSSSLITNGVIPAGTSSTSLSGSISWQHELTPDMSSSLSFNYGLTDNTSALINGASGKQTFFGFTAGISKQFTETLTGNARYSYNERSGGQALTLSRVNSGSYSENIILVGLRKSF